MGLALSQQDVKAINIHHQRFPVLETQLCPGRAGRGSPGCREKKFVTELCWADSEGACACMKGNGQK